MQFSLFWDKFRSALPAILNFVYFALANLCVFSWFCDELLMIHFFCSLHSLHCAVFFSGERGWSRARVGLLNHALLSIFSHEGMFESLNFHFIDLLDFWIFDFNLGYLRKKIFWVLFILSKLRARQRRRRFLFSTYSRICRMSEV